MLRVWPLTRWEDRLSLRFVSYNQWPALWISASALAAVAVATAYAVATDRLLYLVVAEAVMAAVALAVIRLRTMVTLLLAFMPLSGLPILWTYPHTQVALLLKDILFVGPIYLGLLVSAKEVRAVPRAVMQALGVYAIALLYGFGVTLLMGSALASPVLVALVGARVWAFYVPLLFAAGIYIRNRSDLERMSVLLLTLGMIPLSVGLVEQALIFAGHEADVYRAYGAAAQAAFFGFGLTEYASGSAIHRIPSLFSFVTQYYSFLCALIPLAYASMRSASRNKWLARVALAGLVLGAFTSGEKGAFVMVPFLVVLMMLLDLGARTWPYAAIALAAMAGVAWALTGYGPSDLIANLFGIGSGQVGDQFSYAASLLTNSPTGSGLGTSTQAARYLQSDLTAFAGFAAPEAYWGHLIAEMGALGLLAGAVLMGTVIITSLRSLATTPTDLRPLSAALAAYLIWVVANGFKGSLLDVDPANVLFWFYFGLILAMPHLARGEMVP